ncbi:hypothetical protein V8E55_001012 [Tylopilus felleus]
MSCTQARTPHRDMGRRFDDKDELDVTDDTPHRDRPHPSFRHTTPDLACEHDVESEGTTAHPIPDTPHCIIVSVQGDDPILTGLTDETSPRVRFRSRVRIAGGIGRRRRRSDELASSASSISGSRSSSISAPLRTHYTGNNGWVPLGSRIKFVTAQAALIPPCQDDDANGAKGRSSENGDGDARRRSSWTFLDDDADEHTHLLTSTTRYSYVGRHAHDSCYDDRERWREQLVDETFGKWPARLLNQHVSRSCS